MRNHQKVFRNLLFFLDKFKVQEDSSSDLGIHAVKALSILLELRNSPSSFLPMDIEDVSSNDESLMFPLMRVTICQFFCLLVFLVFGVCTNVYQYLENLIYERNHKISCNKLDFIHVLFICNVLIIWNMIKNFRCSCQLFLKIIKRITNHIDYNNITFIIIILSEKYWINHLPGAIIRAFRVLKFLFLGGRAIRVLQMRLIR